ncbi:olfactory receptor 52E4-like [Chelonoidis abingdonii]|uniref:olfactory receptor 52E4-like n=1 Tax=Chelonoidis abingdonii TaxID=106734 RepID=UPI003F49069A
MGQMRCSRVLKEDEDDITRITATLFLAQFMRGECLRPQPGHQQPLEMPLLIYTYSHPSTFILLGIPGLEAAHVWISILFCTVYIITLLGNSTILFIVKTEPSLHQPMIYLLWVLSVVDLGLSTATVPRMLGIFWFNFREISFGGCLTHMFFIRTFTGMESAVLLAMVFDRYVAICDPLRYTMILAKKRIALIGLVIILKPGVLVFPMVFLVDHLPFCRARVLPHAYCEHMGIAKLACGSTNIYYGLIVGFMVTGVDLIFIAVSYIQILRAIFSLPTKDTQLKTFETCGSHLCVIVSSYIPVLFSSFMHRFGHNVPLHFHILMANTNLLVAPVLNPIIYGVRTKQIQVRLLRLLSHKWT